MLRLVLAAEDVDEAQERLGDLERHLAGLDASERKRLADGTTAGIETALLKSMMAEERDSKLKQRAARLVLSRIERETAEREHAERTRAVASLQQQRWAALERAATATPTQCDGPASPVSVNVDAENTEMSLDAGMSSSAAGPDMPTPKSETEDLCMLESRKPHSPDELAEDKLEDTHEDQNHDMHFQPTEVADDTADADQLSAAPDEIENKHVGGYNQDVDANDDSEHVPKVRTSIGAAESFGCSQCRKSAVGCLSCNLDKNISSKGQVPQAKSERMTEEATAPLVSASTPPGRVTRNSMSSSRCQLSDPSSPAPTGSLPTAFNSIEQSIEHSANHCTRMVRNSTARKTQASAASDEDRSFHTASDGTPLCHAGHTLEVILTDADGYRCDRCKQEFAHGTVMHSCASCDWDLCTLCLASLAKTLSTSVHDRPPLNQESASEEETTPTVYCDFCSKRSHTAEGQSILVTRIHNLIGPWGKVYIDMFTHMYVQHVQRCVAVPGPNISPISRKCLENVSEISRKYLENISKISRKYLWTC